MGPGDIRELLLEALMDGETWGMELIRRVNTRHGLVLDQTKVYPNLQKMEGEQLVTSWKDESQPGANGMNTRRFWKLTDVGRDRAVRFQAWCATQVTPAQTELPIATPIATPQKPAEIEASTFTTTAPRENPSISICAQCSARFSSRHCPECGTARGETRAIPHSAPYSAPPAAAPAIAVGPGGEAIAIFMQGFTTSMEAQRRANELARIDADERIRRFELESKITLERERMSHEKALKERESFLDRADRAATAAAASALNPAAIAEIVRGELAPLHQRMEAMEEAFSEEEEKEPEEEEETTPAAPSTEVTAAEGSILEKVRAANAVGREVGSFLKGAGEALGPVANVVGDAITKIRGTNGAPASGAAGE